MQNLRRSGTLIIRHSEDIFFLVDLFQLLECLPHCKPLRIEDFCWLNPMRLNKFELKVIKFPVVLKYKTTTRNAKLERLFMCCK